MTEQSDKEIQDSINQVSQDAEANVINVLIQQKYDEIAELEARRDADDDAYDTSEVSDESNDNVVGEAPVEEAPVEEVVVENSAPEEEVSPAEEAPVEEAPVAVEEAPPAE